MTYSLNQEMFGVIQKLMKNNNKKVEDPGKDNKKTTELEKRAK